MNTSSGGLFSTLFGGFEEEGKGRSRDPPDTKRRSGTDTQSSSNGKWSVTRWAPQQNKSRFQLSPSSQTASSSAASHCATGTDGKKRTYSGDKFETYDAIEGEGSEAMKKATGLSDQKQTKDAGKEEEEEGEAGRTMFIVESKDEDRDLEACYEEGLYTAAKLGDEETILHLIKKGANVNFPNGAQNLESPLHAACIEGNLDAAFALLNHKGYPLRSIDYGIVVENVNAAIRGGSGLLFLIYPRLLPERCSKSLGKKIIFL
eukprot:jgi/Bigna1/142038/aug1.66_g16746